MGTMVMRKPKLPSTSVNLASQRIDTNTPFVVGDNTYVPIPMTADAAYPDTVAVTDGIQIVGYSGLIDLFLIIEWNSTTYSRALRITVNGVQAYQQASAAAIDRVTVPNIAVNAGDIVRLEGSGNVSSTSYRTVNAAVLMLAKAGALIVPKAAGLTMTANGTALPLSTWTDITANMAVRTGYPDTLVDNGYRVKIVGGGKRRLNYRMRFGGSGTSTRGGRIMRLRSGTTTVIHTTQSSGSSVIRTATESIQDFNDGDIIWIQGYCDNSTSTSRVPAATSDGVYFFVEDH